MRQLHMILWNVWLPQLKVVWSEILHDVFDVSAQWRCLKRADREKARLALTGLGDAVRFMCEESPAEHPDHHGWGDADRWAVGQRWEICITVQWCGMYIGHYRTLSTYINSGIIRRSFLASTVSIYLVGPQSSSNQETDSIREVKQDIKARVAEVPLMMRFRWKKGGCRKVIIWFLCPSHNS